MAPRPIFAAGRAAAPTNGFRADDRLTFAPVVARLTAQFVLIMKTFAGGVPLTAQTICSCAPACVGFMNPPRGGI
jgi:hypothetical protein